MINVNQHPFETQKIITADLYKGSIIEKAYGGGDEGTISAQLIRVQLNNKLEKGIISEELHAKAVEQLEELVKGGEGSKGGKIIGHTRSGKPIYANKSAHEYSDFSKEDHKDASDIHQKESSKHDFQKPSGARYVGKNKRQDHIDLSVDHSQKSKGKDDLKKAYDILGIEYKETDSLEKAEGSRGGKIIGHTKSGKPIYEGHGGTESYSAQDHSDAADAHDKVTAKNVGNYVKQSHHGKMAKYHNAMWKEKKGSDKQDLKKAYDILGIEYKETDSLEKASKGEGSKGGHVIGHTKSGRPVYADKRGDNKDYKDFSAQDHKDAAQLHSEKHKFHAFADSNTSSPINSIHHRALMSHHSEVGSGHAVLADKKEKDEHEESIPDHEKKILADKKKKQIDHHKEGEDFHGSLLNDFYKNHGTDENKWSNHMKEAHSQWKDKMFHHKSEKERLEKE